MAENTLPERELSTPEASANNVERVDKERRLFMGRAAVAALPVVLATVRGRTVFAQTGTPSCPASANLSSCTGR